MLVTDVSFIRILNKIYCLLLAVAILLLCSCQPLMKALVGMKKPRALSDSEISKIAQKYGIGEADVYKLDTARFWVTLESIGDSAKQKDWYQPLQVKAFDSLGNSHFHLINCNIGGFPNLDWNRFNTFDTYPLDIGRLKKVDTSFALDTELKMLIPINGVLPLTSSKNIESVIVYWNRMMHKQSKSLIEIVMHYKTVHDSLDIKVYFVNTDAMFVGK